MELSFNAENLSKPWFRALVGVIFIIAGFFCITSPNVSSELTRESCIEGEGTLYELRMDKVRGDGLRGAWLILDDYDISLNIHSSCGSDELTDALLSLEKGAKLKFLHSDNTTIYELWANGEKLLDFDTSKEKIAENISIVIYLGYILLPAGAAFIISVPVVELIKKRKNK